MKSNDCSSPLAGDLRLFHFCCKVTNMVGCRGDIIGSANCSLKNLLNKNYTNRDQLQANRGLPKNHAHHIFSTLDLDHMNLLILISMVINIRRLVFHESTVVYLLSFLIYIVG
ncbi:hypothetical protein S83_035056 [Arachis hypogaea]